MSQLSYITLFRKYDLKIADDAFSKIVSRYNKNIPDKDKSQSEIIPEIMKCNAQFSIEEQFEHAKSDSIDYDRSDFLYVDKDKNYLDELMTWEFSSTFTCIKDEFNLNPYDLSTTHKVIDDIFAYKLLIACRYLLNKKWSDDFEDILDNEWINILANNNQFLYAEYAFRKDPKYLAESESSEESSMIVNNIKKLKNALETYLNPDTLSSELVLVYSVC